MKCPHGILRSRVNFWLRLVFHLPELIPIGDRPTGSHVHHEPAAFSALLLGHAGSALCYCAFGPGQLV